MIVQLIIITISENVISDTTKLCCW